MTDIKNTLNMINSVRLLYNFNESESTTKTSKPKLTKKKERRAVIVSFIKEKNELSAGLIIDTFGFKKDSVYNDLKALIVDGSIKKIVIDGNNNRYRCAS